MLALFHARRIRGSKWAGELDLRGVYVSVVILPFLPQSDACATQLPSTLLRSRHCRFLVEICFKTRAFRLLRLKTGSEIYPCANTRAKQSDSGCELEVSAVEIERQNMKKLGIGRSTVPICARLAL